MLTIFFVSGLMTSLEWVQMVLSLVAAALTVSLGVGRTPNTRGLFDGSLALESATGGSVVREASSVTDVRAINRLQQFGVIPGQDCKRTRPSLHVHSCIGHIMGKYHNQLDIPLTTLHYVGCYVFN